MLTGFLHDGRKFIYDLPEEINDIRKLYHLATGSNYAEGQRSELFGLPKLRGYSGPMYNGIRVPNDVIKWLESLPETEAKPTWV